MDISQFAHPETNTAQFSIDPGMKVADFGAGSGHYTLALARQVGDRGRVYAIDVVKDLLTRLKREGERAHLHNIDIIWGDIEKSGGTTLAPALVDRVVISNVLFQTEDKVGVAHEALRILKEGGRAFIIDWSDSFGGLGPHFSHVIAELDAKKIFKEAGFIFERSFSAGSHHYGLVFRKK